MSRPALVLSGWLLAAAFASGENPHGADVYQKVCASCHGKAGEGVPDKYDEPLYGDRTLKSLARYIDRQMPDDEPEKCTGPDAQDVAAYIYDAFYSPTSIARTAPPKYELAHLTNRQLRESIADLIGSIRPGPAPGAGTGLHAEYYSSEGMNKKKKKAFEREDKVLDFDFGEGAPGEGVNAEQFSIAWNGSLLATETGVYEFRVRTPNGARLYVNTDFSAGDGNHRDDSDAKRQPALIDAWVSSGDQVREETGRLFLLGGRSYPFRLDYFKYMEKHGSVRLEWKPPHGTWTVLGAPYVSPAGAQRVAVIDAPFPADDGSLGYERGTSISREWQEATTKAAIEAGNEVVDRLGSLAHVRFDAPDRAAKLQEFAATFVERAFRRPITPELRDRYVNHVFASGVAPEIAVKRCVLAAIQSPRFLYPDLGETDDSAVASRLALALWDSVPDAPLTDAARKGELHTPEQIRAQAARMAKDPRTHAKLMHFFAGWLGEDRGEDMMKDPKVFPGFDAALVADLRESLELFVNHVIESEHSDYRELLQADYLYLNPRLAKFYGVNPPASGGFEQVHFDSAQRAGIFTHPFLLTTFSYPKNSSPIHRGVFLMRNVLGRTLKPPPKAVEFKEEAFDPKLSMREKVTEITNKPVCLSCHANINPLGFALENFDAVGRYRTVENNKPVNAAATYESAEGDKVELHGPRDLANYTAGSEIARRGFVRKLFQYSIKEAPNAFASDTLLKLDAAFASSGCHIRNLFTDIAVTAALGRRAPAQQASR